MRLCEFSSCVAPFLLLLPLTAHAEVQVIGPLPYLSAADSPFLADPLLDVVLEDFEDGVLNVPGVTSEPPEIPEFFFGPFVNDGRGIVVGPGFYTDSVDGDDGNLDGFGRDGHSFRSTAATLNLNETITGVLNFSFVPRADGSYPNVFGFVWTDGEPDPEAMVEVSIQEIEFDGSTENILFTYPTVDGDDAFDGGTTDDQFLGFISDNGIESVRIASTFGLLSQSDDGSTRQLFFEMDHLQYGYAVVPEPTTITLLAGFLVLSRAVVRRHGYLETKSVPE